jgi:predicted GNAT superfamily acetyltransferase
MTQNSKSDIPILIPMFNIFNEVMYVGKKINEYMYIAVGQVCVAKEYRGQGIVDNCYATYKKYYRDKYDFAITEIASTNVRSLNAHYRIGFKEIEIYDDADSTKWVIVLWDWKKDK